MFDMPNYGALEGADLRKFRSRKDIETFMQSNGAWANSGVFNPLNEKIVDKYMQKATEFNLLADEKDRIAAAEQAGVVEAGKQAEQRAKQKTKAQSFAGRKGTILTSPLGLSDQAAAAPERKTLLGQ